MKTLYITYDGLSDTLGRSQVLPYLEKLAEKGHRIHIVSLEKKERIKINAAHLEKRLKEKNIKWSYKIYSSGIPLASQQKNLNKLRALSKKVFLQEHPEIVHCRSYIAALIGLRLKKKYSCKFIFDMRGFWVDERVEGKLWNIKNPIYKKLFSYFKKKEKRFFTDADQIVSLTQTGKKEILKMIPGLNENKITVIPCCADEALFSISVMDNNKIQTLKKDLGITEKDMVLSYLGSIGTWYMLDEMLSFFHELRTQNKNFKFLFLTPDDPNEIRTKAKQHKVPASSIIIRSVAREDVPLYISISDLSIYFIRPSFSKKASSPTKMAEILFMGKPIITNAGIGDSDSIFKNEKIGVVIDSFSQRSYREAINELPELLAEPPSHFAAVALSHFSLEKGAAEYHKIYERLKN